MSFWSTFVRQDGLITQSHKTYIYMYIHYIHDMLFFSLMLLEETCCFELLCFLSSLFFFLLYTENYCFANPALFFCLLNILIYLYISLYTFVLYRSVNYIFHFHFCHSSHLHFLSSSLRFQLFFIIIISLLLLFLSGSCLKCQCN